MSNIHSSDVHLELLNFCKAVLRLIKYYWNSFHSLKFEIHKMGNLSHSLLVAWFGKQFLGQGSRLTVSEVAGTVKFKVLMWNTFTVSADLLPLCSVYSALTEFLQAQVSWAGATLPCMGCCSTLSVEE